MLTLSFRENKFHTYMYFQEDAVGAAFEVFELGLSSVGMYWSNGGCHFFFCVPFNTYSLKCTGEWTFY